MRLSLLRAPLALALLATLATASSGNAATAASMRALPGSGLPLVRVSTRLAATSDATPVSVVVSLRPRNRGLLAHAAAAASGRAPMSEAALRQAFAPSPGSVVAITRYMRSRGFRLTSSGMLTLSFSGDAGAARRAFGVGLSTYRSPSGREFRAPDGAVRLPPGLAPLVQDVSGLDTALRLRRHAQAAIAPQPALSSCTLATQGQTFYENFGGVSYQPDELAMAYNHDDLIAAGGDGSGETIGLVEFTSYRLSDVTDFLSCYGLSTPVSHVQVDGGSRTLSAAIEAELDIEVAATNAPGVGEVRVYDAPNNVAEILPMLDQMHTDGVTVVSDSWGLCEPFLPLSFQEAEANQLEMLAVAGISFFAATGDSGSSDCSAASGGAVKGLFADDPSSQPFATAVGGTTMTSADKTTSTAWKFGGGGVSGVWPQPAYQIGYEDVTNDDGVKCGNPDGFCRQTPDVALDANPNTGYIIHCTVTSSGCPSSHTWFPVGGTSAAAPLMAAIAADANTYSFTLNTGPRMGFANPFLYDAYDATPNTGTFFDVTAGNNSITGHPSLYQAASGYDLTTGLGSPDAMNLATALAAYVPAVVSVRPASQVTISTPATAKTIVYGKAVTFSGNLQSNGANLVHRRVYIRLVEGPKTYLYAALTDTDGNWSLKLSKALRRNLTWSADFPGSDLEAADKAAGHAIHVIPHISSATSTTSAKRNVSFTFRGVSNPNMHGVKLQLQARRSTGASWKTLKLIAVAKNGSYSALITVSSPGPVYLRWRYAGGTSKPWMSAVSPSRRVSIL